MRDLSRTPHRSEKVCERTESALFNGLRAAGTKLTAYIFKPPPSTPERFFSHRFPRQHTGTKRYIVEYEHSLLLLRRFSYRSEPRGSCRRLATATGQFDSAAGNDSSALGFQSSHTGNLRNPIQLQFHARPLCLHCHPSECATERE